MDTDLGCMGCDEGIRNLSGAGAAAKENQKRWLQKRRAFVIITAYIARPVSAGRDENGLKRLSREPPVGVRRSKAQPIRSSHAAGEESAEWRPLQRFEWSADADNRPRAKALLVTSEQLRM